MSDNHTKIISMPIIRSKTPATQALVRAIEVVSLRPGTQEVDDAYDDYIEALLVYRHGHK